MRRPSTRWMARLSAGVLAAAAATAWISAPAHAQMPAPPPPPAPATEVPAEAAPPPPAAMTPAPPPPPIVVQPMPAPAMERGPSDLDVEARRVAIGYGGISQVPAGTTVLTVPSLALRYWLNPNMGLDVGVGFAWAGGSSDSNGTSTDKDSVWGVVLQAGLPFALATHRHVSFQVIPFLAFAHGQTSTSAGGTTTTTDFSGNRFDIGARAGFEVFFGFIGIPELALSATVGAEFKMVKVSQDNNGFSVSDTTLEFSTTVQNNPWDIFTGNVAARYYF